MAAAATQESPRKAGDTAGQGSRVRWSEEEWTALALAGINIRRDEPKISDRQLLIRAMNAALTPSRRREVKGVKRNHWDLFLKAVDQGMDPTANTATLGNTDEPAAGAGTGLEEDLAIVVPAEDAILFENQVGPALETLDTLSLVAVAISREIIQRQKDALVLQDLIKRVNEMSNRITSTSAAALSSRAMLLRVLQEMGIHSMADAANIPDKSEWLPPHVRETTAQNGIYTRGRKLKVCLVGGVGGLGAEVVRSTADYATVDYEHQSKVAAKRGFLGYDHVICTRYSGHDAVQKARSQLGRDRVTATDMNNADAVIARIKQLAGASEGVLAAV